MRLRVEGLVVALMLMGATGEAWTAQPPADDAEALPSAGLLEFLGLLVAQGDGYLDPMDLATLEDGELASGDEAVAEDEAEEVLDADRN